MTNSRILNMFLTPIFLLHKKMITQIMLSKERLVNNLTYLS